MSKEALRANRWKRFDDWDDRPLSFDQFAREDAEQGFAAWKGSADPKPEVKILAGKVVGLDGTPSEKFDIIDEFIASYHLDQDIAKEAMAISSKELARMLVDINVSRSKLIRLARGLTPAKLADVVAQLSSLELSFAYAKMRARETPGNQGHVTNAKDDPLQLAADASIAVALGFDEIETTMRVARNSWSNALACCVGSSVGRAGVLFQCSSEEAEELRIGMSGFTSYAETVSVYGSEEAFIDGDDTPWSKAWLTASYASRGIKMRCTSGAAAELLMGFHESKSLLYLEARCLCMQRGMGAQGTQNGGIDGAPLASSIPGGVRELLAENLLAVWLDLECASGNDARHSESEIRVGAKITPYLLAGSDFICSGFGTILKYDNSFNPSSFNGEEIEDFLALQRDFEADGGLTSLDYDKALSLRSRAVDAISAVLEELNLATPDEDMKTSVVYSSGSETTNTFSAKKVGEISKKIETESITVIDVIKALHRKGFVSEAENLLFLIHTKLSGDYLQTSAIIRENKIISAVNLPNHYKGPGTGYQLSETRRQELIKVRNELNKESVLKSESLFEKKEILKIRYNDLGEAKNSEKKNEVVVAISPAFGIKFFQTLAGHSLSDVLKKIKAGIEKNGKVMKVIRCKHTADTSFLGLTAARLSGSGIGIGLQAKGTAVIHQKDRLPHNNLELFSNAPITTLSHYYRLGENAAHYSEGNWPEPILIQNKGEALGARFHARVALIFSIETGLTNSKEKPRSLEIEFL